MTFSASDKKVLIGVIGGSGLYQLDNLTEVEKVNPETPWGFPSSPITIAALPNGAHLAFLARHGPTHSIAPSAVPARANIAALKSLGVRAIVAFSAVGSLREEIAPGDFVLPSQIIDRTKGVRPASFFDGTGSVAHAGFGDPFSGALVDWLAARMGGAVEGWTVKVEGEGGKEEERGVRVHEGKCVVCMEGPQFSTRAESAMYRQWGGDIINMSVLPEAKLAREAELGYALVATATDYDSWRPHSASVTAADVFATLSQNAALSKHVTAALLGELAELAQAEQTGSLPDSARTIVSSEVGSMRFSIMPHALENLNDEGRARLAYVLPEYFGDVAVAAAAGKAGKTEGGDGVTKVGEPTGGA